MSSNNNNKVKRNKPLSTSSLCKTTSKYTTRSQTADKATSYRQTREPDKLTLSDQNIMDQITNVLSEDYNGGDNNTVLPTFDTTANTPHEDKTKYTSKTQTEHERQIREENFTQINNLPQLPVESDCGSLYPETGHNQNNQQIASQNIYDTNKRM